MKFQELNDFFNVEIDLAALVNHVDLSARVFSPFKIEKFRPRADDKIQKVVVLVLCKSKDPLLASEEKVKHWNQCNSSDAAIIREFFNARGLIETYVTQKGTSFAINYLTAK